MLFIRTILFAALITILNVEPVLAFSNKMPETIPGLSKFSLHELDLSTALTAEKASIQSSSASNAKKKTPTA